MPKRSARLSATAEAPEKGALLSLALADALAPQLAQYVDPIDGGLRGAPKFPNPPIFEFLWRAGGRLGEKSYRDLVRLTLTQNVGGRHLRSSRRRLCALFD